MNRRRTTVLVGMTGILITSTLMTAAPRAIAQSACTSPNTTTIPQIQGTGPVAAITGNVVVEGVVIGDYEGPAPALRGFYLQDPNGDADLATSDAIFVFNPAAANAVSLGDRVQVTGSAAEFQEQTQISATQVQLCGSTASITPIDVAFPLPSSTALEPFEGMLVRIPQTMTVTETFQLGRFGQVVVSSGGRLIQPTQVFAAADPQRAELQTRNALNRLIIDDDLQNQNADPIRFGRGGQPLSATNTLRGGDSISNAVGVLTFTWAGNAASPNAYRLRPLNALTGAAAFTPTNARPAAPPAVGGAAKVASFNLLNYFNSFGRTGCTLGVGGAVAECRGAENQIEFDRQAPKTIAALTKLDADIVGVIEVENDGYGADTALQDLVNRLNTAQGAGTWALVDADAATGTVNAVGTDAIKVGLLYKPGKVTPVTGTTRSPITSTTFERRPLAQTFTDTTGSTFTVVVNHFKSKSCASPAPVPPDADVDQLDGQGCFNARRTTQANELSAFISTTVIPAAGDPDVLIIGDLNSYAKEAPIAALTATGYIDLATAFASDAYSYVFDGQWGTLDYALASSSLRAQITGAGEYHINADEPGVLDYNTNFKSAGQLTSLYAADEFRTSDHDPLLVGIAGTPPSSFALGDVSIQEGNMGTTPATFTVTRTGGTQPATLQYRTVAGTATGGADFTETTGEISFAADETSKTITVDIVGDIEVEADETFLVEISGTGFTFSDATGEATIVNDDIAPPLPAINLRSERVTERDNNSRVSVGVRLAERSTTPVTVTWRTVPGTALAGSDYVEASGKLTLKPGERRATISVVIIGDRVREDTETFTVEIVSVQGATAGTNATVTIRDDDRRGRDSREGDPEEDAAEDTEG